MIIFLVNDVYLDFLMFILFKNLCCLKKIGVGIVQKLLDFIYEKMILECCLRISWDFGGIWQMTLCACYVKIM